MRPVAVGLVGGGHVAIGAFLQSRKDLSEPADSIRADDVIKSG